MCLKGLNCFGSPDYESDSRSPDRRHEHREKRHDGSRSSPKPPESSDVPWKPRQFGDSNGRVDSYSPSRVTEDKHESPKRAPQVSTFAEKGNSDSLPKVKNTGVDPYEVPSGSPVKPHNATADSFVSNYEPQHVTKEKKAPAKASDGRERPNHGQGLVWRE